jgi:predicted MPP superfamily phosphohydrolase
MRSPSRIAIFLGIVIVFLYIANLVVYEGLALAFNITAGYQLLTLGALLGVSAAGFIGMMILGSYYYNVFTRVMYTLLAVWMGTFGNLFFASAVFGILILVAPIAGVTVPLQTLGQVLFGAAVLVSIYGVVHAKKITAAHYSVHLPNLPAEWKGKRALWISDLHLGQLHGPKFAAKVAEAVNAQKPDIIFVGGDLYDGTGAPDPYDLVKPLEAMTAPWGVFYITGNHEEFGDNSGFIHSASAVGMRVLMDELVNIHGLNIIGVDYAHANDAGRFSEILSAQSLDKSKPTILLKHEPNNLHIAEEAGISLQISGHTHYGQQWPFGYLAQLSYQGYAYGLKPFKNMQQLTSSGIGTWGPPLRVGSNAEMVVITFS